MIDISAWLTTFDWVELREEKQPLHDELDLSLVAHFEYSN
jgi:hypothetical protein